MKEVQISVLKYECDCCHILHYSRANALECERRRKCEHKNSNLRCLEDSIFRSCVLCEKTIKEWYLGDLEEFHPTEPQLQQFIDLFDKVREENGC